MKRNKILLVVAVLSGAVLFSKAYEHGNSGSLKLPHTSGSAAEVADTTKEYNSDLLKQFESVCKEMDESQNKIAFSGTLYMEDKADTLNKPQAMPVTLCRVGKEIYYKIGDTEMLNSDDYYLFIDHGARKILLSEPKQLLAASVMDIRKMKDALRSEDYELKGSIQGSNTTISLINENHITCKEYAITFDTATHAVNKFFMRFTNTEDPLGKNNEKIVELKITDRDVNPDIKKYLNDRTPVIRDGTELKLKKEYIDYKLIRL